MFIYNFKLSKTNIFKIFFVIAVIILFILFIISAYKIYSTGKNSNTILPSSTDVAEITTQNYTNILKTVHENIDTYVGQKIKFSGYIYKAEDFNKNQFVLARDMLINDNKQSLIVGFLCECKNADDLPDKAWVEITGTITKGDYHGSIPIIKVKEINQIEKPQDEFVYPPDDNYLPTSALAYTEN